MADSETGGGVKVGWGVALQLIIGLVVGGIAWGTLSAKQSAMELTLAGLTQTNAAIYSQVTDLKLEIMRLKTLLGQHRGWAGDDSTGDRR